MKYTENALNILTVRSFPQKGPAWIHNNLKGNETVDLLCDILETHEFEFCKRKNRIKKVIDELDNYLDGVVALGDDNFPLVRGNVKAADKPFTLFYKGNIGLLQKENLNIAVIGVLNPDEKVEFTEKMVTKEILKYNATIVSGLALGCDTIAHKTAVENDGNTIAILPSPINNIIPKDNMELANEIVAHNGLLVTEYYDEPNSRNDMISRFVVRDRLQALFSDAVLLAASYALNNLGNDSGSRHAMGKAKDYGIKRAVIYNELKHRDVQMFDLNRQILREDNSVIRIDSGNMEEMVRKMIYKQAQIQTTLF